MLVPLKTNKTCFHIRVVYHWNLLSSFTLTDYNYNQKEEKVIIDLYHLFSGECRFGNFSIATPLNTNSFFWMSIPLLGESWSDPSFTTPPITHSFHPSSINNQLFLFSLKHNSNQNDRQTFSVQFYLDGHYTDQNIWSIFLRNLPKIRTI